MVKLTLARWQLPPGVGLIMCTCGGMHVALLHVLRAVLPFLCIHIIFPCDRFPRSIFWAAAFFRIASQFRNHQARKRWGRWVPEGATVKRGAMHVVKPKRGRSAPPRPRATRRRRPRRPPPPRSQVPPGCSSELHSLGGCSPFIPPEVVFKNPVWEKERLQNDPKVPPTA